MYVVNSDKAKYKIIQANLSLHQKQNKIKTLSITKQAKSLLAQVC